MVISATSRAMAAPSRMAMPASSLGERRGVVHAVAEHDYAPSGLVLAADEVCLCPPEAPQVVFVTPTAAATDLAVRSLSPVIITSFGKAELAQPRMTSASSRRGVFHAYHRGEHTARRRGTGVNTPRESVQTSPLPLGDDAASRPRTRSEWLPMMTFFAVHAARCRARRYSSRSSGVPHGRMAVFRLRDDGLGHGVRVVLFKTRSEREHVVFFLAAERHDCRHARSAWVSVPVLSKTMVSACATASHEAASFDGDVMDLGFLHAGEHRDRHGS